ncbi:restriction endonuclease subunit S [Streptomyces sp. NBC_00464]|uniref:restriction endonuclease subunit S n=1 Tax=Streptomyces sp. NBC_00464 TaxID=2975751 RepID=UPI002E1861E8
MESDAEGTGAPERAAIELPASWSWAELDDLRSADERPVTDGPFGSNLATRHYTHSGPRVLRLQNIGDGEFRDVRTHIPESHFERLAVHEAREGDLVIASLGDDLPRACIVPEHVGPAIVKADCIRFRAHPEVSTEWLLRALIAPATKQHAAASLRGIGRARLGLNGIRSLPVPVPPAAEQRRIADALDTRLARLARIEERLVTAQQHLARLGDMVMVAAATGILASDSDPQHVTLDNSPGVTDGELPPLATGWRWARLQDIADVVGGVTKDSKSQDDSGLPEVPYLRVANAQRARLDLSQVTKIRVAPKALKKLRLRAGDLLMAEGGDRDKLGRGWIWEDQIKECIHQNHLFRARVQEHATQPKLLGWYVNSAARSWFEANGKQSVNLASISISKVKMLPVPVPSADRDDQKAFVALGERVFSRFHRLTDACEQGLAHVTALRRILLSEAFAGRLVPQDPHDEPAEDLLKRIRAEREAAEAERKEARRAAAQARRKEKQAAAGPPTATPPPASHTPLPEGEQTTLPLEFTE